MRKENLSKKVKRKIRKLKTFLLKKKYKTFFQFSQSSKLRKFFFVFSENKNY